jgi:hypothetical protein
LERLDYDDTGKIKLDDVYNDIDPTAYFETLRQLDYQIPQHAKPHFQSLIAAKRQFSDVELTKVVDLGCSYGVNGALLKHGFSMDDLYQIYGSGTDDPERRLQRHRDLYAEPADPALDIIGVDTARRAISYGIDVGTLDAGIAVNLEKTDLTPRDAATIENADLIISTGCMGYVTETSLERLLEASASSEPWMAHFVLRMFDFGGSETMLSEHGYVTEKAEGLHRQRRFASGEEQQHVLDNLAQMGIDPSGAEADGWYFAELHVARPENVAKAMPLESVLGSVKELELR